MSEQMRHLMSNQAGWSQLVISALADNPGLEPFRLAGMLGVSTAQANEWLAELVVQGYIDRRRRQADASGRLRTRYYVHVSQSIAPRITACAPTLLAAMVRGQPYGLMDLIRLTGFTRGRGKAVIAQLVASGHIVAIFKRVKNRSTPRFAYFLAEPDVTESAKADLDVSGKRKIIGGDVYDMEYGRTLLMHRDLCNARRYRS
ncbi:MarR family transcriptional regulator [Burkholderia cenocepacia]|uniref:MarR family transcriptional regulator n=1 Tax=Burkholderia cenocepacia TaxID=95486 RepID=UPI000F5946DA|nr:helix-turn-helix domain-containing protein [Burkholderia cenocepacia]